MNRVREVLDQIDKPHGLYPNYLNPRSGVWGSRKFNVFSHAVTVIFIELYILCFHKSCLYLAVANCGFYGMNCPEIFLNCM